VADNAIWMVRAGQGAAFVEDFIDNNFVGIGFRQAGEVTSPVQKDAVIAAMQLHPNCSASTMNSKSGMT